MSRETQRENRRRKHYEESRAYKPWKNPEGYMDMTAYLAIQNVDREKRQKRTVTTK